MSDNGPQFSLQEFREFSRDYNFNHITSSPHFPQSNGQAERGVKTVKKLIKEAKDPFLALLSYRATPLPWCNLSPAELLMGRAIRSNIPQLEKTFHPKWPYLHKFRQDNDRFKKRQKSDFDRRHWTRPLTEIPNNTEVLVHINDHSTPGRVTGPANTPRSYLVETQGGQQIRRNRSHLTPIPDRDQANDDMRPRQTRSPIQTRMRTGVPINPPKRL